MREMNRMQSAGVRVAAGVAALGLGLLFGGPAAAQPAGDAAPPASGPAATQAEGPSKPSPNKAWISGKILDAEGKPMADFELRAEKNEPRSVGGGGATGTGGPREYRVRTDAEGAFVMKEVDVTAYILIAGNNDVGWIYQDVAVKPGQVTDVGTVQLVKVTGGEGQEQ